MLPEPASYQDERGQHVEPGLIEMLEYMRLGKFKVFRGSGQQFMEEIRMYHRKDGAVVKERDDIISAARYAFVCRRMAAIPPHKVILSHVPQRPLLGQGRWKGRF